MAYFHHVAEPISSEWNSASIAPNQPNFIFDSVFDGSMTCRLHTSPEYVYVYNWRRRLINIYYAPIRYFNKCNRTIRCSILPLRRIELPIFFSGRKTETAHGKKYVFSRNIWIALRFIGISVLSSRFAFRQSNFWCRVNLENTIIFSLFRFHCAERWRARRHVQHIRNTRSVCNRLGGDTTAYFSRVNIQQKANKYVLFVFYRIIYIFFFLAAEVGKKREIRINYFEKRKNEIKWFD